MRTYIKLAGDAGRLAGWRKASGMKPVKEQSRDWALRTAAQQAAADLETYDGDAAARAYDEGFSSACGKTRTP